MIHHVKRIVVITLASGSFSPNLVTKGYTQTYAGCRVHNSSRATRGPSKLRATKKTRNMQVELKSKGKRHQRNQNQTHMPNQPINQSSSSGVPSLTSSHSPPRPKVIIVVNCQPRSLSESPASTEPPCSSPYRTNPNVSKPQWSTDMAVSRGGNWGFSSSFRQVINLIITLCVVCRLRRFIFCWVGG
jgi:hypothetical protein